MKYPNVTVHFRKWRGIEARSFQNLIEAVQYIGYEECMNLKYGRIFGQFALGVEWGQHDNYIVYDNQNRVIHKDIVKAVATNHAPPNGWVRRYRRNKKHTFRVGPVEGIGIYRNCRRRRGMKVTQEIRENEFLQYDDDCIEHGIKERVKRNCGNLPQWYDDIYKSNTRSNSWKNYRKQQWK